MKHSWLAEMATCPYVKPWSERQQALFSKKFVDSANVARWLQVEYAGKLIRTDDYPHVKVHLSWPDGRTYDVESDEQTPYMLPWKIGPEERKTYNADISRAVAALLPPGALNRRRLSGDMLAAEYAQFIQDAYEQNLDEIDAEIRLGSQLRPLQANFKILSLAIQILSSDDLDGENALQAHVYDGLLPKNAFVNMTVFLRNDTGLAGLDEAIAASRHYERLLLSVPWLHHYLTTHPAVTLELRLVEKRSISPKLAADLLSDLRQHGKVKLAALISKSVAQSAFFYLEGSDQAYARWFALPDGRTVLWNFRTRTPLQEKLAGLPTWDWYGHVGVGALFDPQGSLIRP
jgi:hypothetical protein